MVELANQSAIVTGGASGIGRACAEALARCGASVVVGDLDELPENRSLFDALAIEFVRCDVRCEADMQTLIARAASRAALRVLVNNAGVGLVKPITDVSEEDWDRCLDTNLKGAFLACKHAIPLMREAGGGSIVNVASNAGLLPRAHDPVYSISKAALIALTNSLALCHSVDRIRVNCVCPGPVGDTRMMEADLGQVEDREATERQVIAASPLARAHGRMIRPAEVADAVLYLASDAACMVSGTAIAIDGAKSRGVPPNPDRR